MATPGELRLLEELADGTVAEFSPVINEEGRVSYPDVERHLGVCDSEPYEVLESLAHRGILYREFRKKAYVCPECGGDGMEYTTVCAECGSRHTIEEELLEHVECGEVALETAFQTPDGEYICPRCEDSVGPEQTELFYQHVCQSCGAHAAGSMGALRCRSCASVVEPRETIEWVIYGYGLEQYGEEWLATQLAGRQALAELLDDRGFAVEVDTTVSGNDTERAVHLYAEEELLGDRVVGGVHECPDGDDVERLHRTAQAVDARMVLVSTSGSVTERAEELAHSSDAGFLSLQQDGSLRREYDTAVSTERNDSPTVFERLTSSVRRQFNR